MGTTRKTTDQRCLTIDIVVNQNTVTNFLELRNTRDARRQPHMESFTSEELALDNLRLLAELPEQEVVT